MVGTDIEKPKIMWLSDAPFNNTGYSTQSLYLMNGLVDKGWDVTYMAHTYMGMKFPPNHIQIPEGPPIKFEIIGSGRETYCQDLIVPYLRERRFDVYGVLLDLFMLYPAYLQKNYAPAKTTFWFPSDGGGGLPQSCQQMLPKIHMPVPMSRYAERQVSDRYRIQTKMIPHACDHTMFKPLSEEDRNKAKIKYKVNGKFVIGVMGRNQPRKMMDRILKSFRLFADKVPEAVLLCHTDPYDAATNFNMQSLIFELNLQNRVIFTGVKYYQGLTYEEMNNVYNVMDIMLSSTSGEGFGVGTIEAMACEVPIVITDYTTTHELIVEDGRCGEPVKLVGIYETPYTEEMLNKGYTQQQIDKALGNGTITGAWNVERALMDIYDARDKLMKLYKDPELRMQYGKVGREKVLKYYTWPVVIDQWDKRLRELIGR